MLVIKRNNQAEQVQFDKILFRLKAVSEDLRVDSVVVAQKVVSGLYDGIKTQDIDTLIAETAAVLTTEHPDYSKLASRVAVSNLHKQTKNFYQTMKDLYKAGILSSDFIKLVKLHGKKLEKHIDYTRDFDLTYFAFKTLEKSYLLKINNIVVERVQHLFMRTALQVAGSDFDHVLATYDLISKGYYTHATPTLFNSGTTRPQLASCFLMSCQDSIDGIYDALKEAALISKFAGGIGVHMHNIRAKGSNIKGTNGISNGVVPMLKVWNETARYVDQCFHPKTPVFTDQGMKTFDEIVIGDRVFSHDGSLERVSKVFRQNNMDRRRILSLKVKHSYQPVLVTEAHPFLVIKDQGTSANFSVIKKRIKNGTLKPDWVDAKDLNERDMIAFAIPQYTQDIEEYSEDDCRFYGCMVGDGHISKQGNQAYICGNPSKDDFNFYKNYLVGYETHLTEHNRDNYQRLCFTPHASLFKFGRVHFYDNQGEKIIHKSLLSLPLNKALQIVKGVLETDGHLGVKEIVLEMTSKNVIDGIRYILLRAGILTSGGIVNRIGNTHDGITTKKLSYRLRIPKTKLICDLLDIEQKSNTVNFLRYENYLFSRVKKKTLKNYQGVIYDLETEGPNHTYLTQAGIVHNGGGKRKGSIAIYLEPWHSDIEDLLQLKKPTGKDELRARDLFYALWVPDLFMKRVEADGVWSLMCPNECPGLADTYGDEFEALYNDYEAEGKYRKQVRARDLMVSIIEAQIETGGPYFLFKDSINRKSNQKNIGMIKSSNLCTEIVEVSNENEIAVCNLASICLSKYVKDGAFDYEELHRVTKVATYNLNHVIDLTFYPLKKTSKSNLTHRPIGLGVQGLADVFFLLDLPFESKQALDINKKIFETIYHAALEASCELAERDGPYTTFKGSPASEGILQFDYYDLKPDMYDWDALKAKIKEKGLRNSLLVAPMPTASTAQIFDNKEAFEAQGANISKREVLAGEFIVVNKYLIRKLEDLHLWNKEMRDKIINGNGSIQHIKEIPENIREIYKTVWEISQKTVIDMAADRGVFVDQSQSMNLHLADPNVAQVNSALFHGWKRGLKTGLYYLRSKAAMTAQKVTTQTQTQEEKEEDLACSLDNPEACVACSA